MTSAVSGPLVPGDHARGKAIRGTHCGSTTWAENRLRVQPRPHGPHASRCAFSRPQPASLSRVHSLARFRFGEAVSRGPITSDRYPRVSITFEFFRPSSLILTTCGGSGSAWALRLA